MKDNSLPRILVILFSTVVFVAVLVVNALAGAGKSPFHSSTGNVSARYDTDITPAGWTFSIWGVIYTWLTLMVIYITSYVFRGMMLAALVVLVLVACANYSSLFFVSFATDYYGLWLQSYHKKDLACLRILVQNGLAFYTTWSSIAVLLNFSVVLHLWGVEKSTAATASLCILFAELLGWFILENWVLDRWVRNILTVYPVVIVALVGNVYKHFNPADPTPNTVFMVVQLVVACILFVSRVCSVIWRNKWRPLHSPGSARLMVSPLDGSKFGICT
ncbi:uncharacterized protein LOC105923790 isoform X2 [Fundulus heteroclitus]|uniref:uncharacterized protein LOC105923790 isoform X2 n=1 Tax=Fundulus heteroclitus TaxID=8078 RepID=UPI00165B1BAF|nr:uncharacterized protein LOC105923790 isoform X2 [Fundulus heteroclitus]